MRPIDMAEWLRTEWFEHYRRRRPTYCAMTVDVDVTDLQAASRAAERKSYPAQIWAVATVVNRHPEFRMALDEHGDPAVWDVVDPSFTVFNPERETFCNAWTDYVDDFATFHDRVAELLAEHRSATTPFPQGFPPPSNLFDISSIPWTPFSGFALHMETGWDHFAPAFTIGGFRTDGDRILMPLSLQIHHAVADGFHMARLVRELRDLVADPHWLG